MSQLVIIGGGGEAPVGRCAEGQREGALECMCVLGGVAMMLCCLVRYSQFYAVCSH